MKRWEVSVCPQAHARLGMRSNPVLSGVWMSVGCCVVLFLLPVACCWLFVGCCRIFAVRCIIAPAACCLLFGGCCLQTVICCWRQLVSALLPMVSVVLAASLVSVSHVHHLSIFAKRPLRDRSRLWAPSHMPQAPLNKGS